MNIDYTIDEKKDCHVLTTFKIPKKDFEETYQKLLKKEAKNIDIKGFRKGKVPANTIEAELKPKVSIQTLETITPKYIAELIKKEELQLLAPPEYIEFPNLEEEKDLELKVKFTVFPEVKLGDFSKITVKEEKTDATKEEIQNTLKEMFEKTPIEDKGEEPSDKWAKQIAELHKLENVKNLKDLEGQIKDLIQKEKERIVKQNQEHEIFAQAIKLSNIEIPKEAVDFEANEREKSLIENLKQSNLTIEDFCKQRNVEIKELKELWQKDAKEALEGEVLLKTYSIEKKIEVSKEELEGTIENLKKEKGDSLTKEVENDEVWRKNIENVIKKQKAYKDLISKALK